MKNIFILDYGLGNIASVKKAINKLGYNSIVSDQISLNKKYDSETTRKRITTIRK